MKIVISINAEATLGEEEVAEVKKTGVDVINDKLAIEAELVKKEVAAALGFPIEYMTKFGVTIVTEDIEGESV